MTDLSDHIQQMDDQDLWYSIGDRIQSAHDERQTGDTVLIGLTISEELLDHTDGDLARGIAIGPVWGVDHTEESKAKLQDHSDAVLEFPNDRVIYIDPIREELVRVLGDADGA